MTASPVFSHGRVCMADTQGQDYSTQIAQTVLEGYVRHFTAFQHVTSGAKARFETADWEGQRDAAQQRIRFYDDRVDDGTEIAIGSDPPDGTDPAPRGAEVAANGPTGGRERAMTSFPTV